MENESTTVDFILGRARNLESGMFASEIKLKGSHNVDTFVSKTHVGVRFRRIVTFFELLSYSSMMLGNTRR